MSKSKSEEPTAVPPTTPPPAPSAPPAPEKQIEEWLALKVQGADRRTHNRAVMAFHAAKVSAGWGAHQIVTEADYDAAIHHALHGVTAK
jgi:hypothetical protein